MEIKAQIHLLQITVDNMKFLLLFGHSLGSITDRTLIFLKYRNISISLQ